MSIEFDKFSERVMGRIDAVSHAREATASHEQRDFSGPWGPYSDGTIPPPWYDGGAIDSGGTLGLPPMDEARAHRHGTVVACISLLADTCMQLPLETFELHNGVRQQVESPELIANPNSELYDFDFWHQTAESLIGNGNTFLRVLDRDRLQYPSKLLPIHPDNVEVTRNRQTGRRQYRILGGYAREPETIYGDGAQRDMIHIPGFTVPGALVGLNRIGKAMVSIYSGLASEMYGARWFKDSANPSSVLYSEQPVGDEAIKQTQREWLKAHQGRRLPAVLSGFQWKPISISPNESQFIETQKWSVIQIARWWRCPPHLVGDVEKSTSWGSGIEEQGLGFVTYGLGPYLHRIERVFTAITKPGQYHVHNVEELLRGRTLERYMSYVHARNAGWMSVNDIRRRENMPPVEGGDTYMQPLNMGPLGFDPHSGMPQDDPTRPPKVDPDE